LQFLVFTKDKKMKHKNLIILTIYLMSQLPIFGCSHSITEGVIEEVYPNPGSSGVDTFTDITVRVNLPLDSSSFHKSPPLTVTTTKGDSIQGDFAINQSGTQITFIPHEELTSGEDFVVCLSHSLKTVSGGSVDTYKIDPDLEHVEPLKNRCYSFSTKSDLVVRGAFSLSSQKEIRVYFSRDLDLESFTETDITYEQNQNTDTVTMRYSPTKKMLLLYPQGGARLDQPLTLTMPGSISTPDGVHLDEKELDILISPIEK